MLKKNALGEVEEYDLNSAMDGSPARKEGESHEEWAKRFDEHTEFQKKSRADFTVDSPPDGDTEPNLKCECGSDDFKVCWWDYEYTGGYCRVVCSGCGEDLTLIDDCS